MSAASARRRTLGLAIVATTVVGAASASAAFGAIQDGAQPGGSASGSAEQTTTHILFVSKNSSTGNGRVTSTPAGIDCGTTCSRSFVEGAQVTLTATPGRGSTFVTWQGGGCTGTGLCHVTMDHDWTVTARFRANPPHNLTQPKVAGSGIVGTDLTCSNGTWSGAKPIVYSRQWLRDGKAIPGATSKVYTVKSSDGDHLLVCRVTATNAGGTVVAASDVVRGLAPPVNKVLPKISGTPKFGNKLSSTNGIWSGSKPMPFFKQWLRDGEKIPGATHPRYTAKASDVGHAISCRVTAKNPAGQASATSAAVTISGG